MSAHELAAAYALGALDPADRSEADALFAADPAFRREVESYREVAGLMAWAAPVTVPPAGLRDRILSSTASVRPISSAPSVTRPVVDGRPARRWMTPMGWLAAAACLTFALVSQRRLADLRDATGALQGELVAVRGELSEKERTLAAFLGPEVHVVSLAQAEQKPSARVFWNHTRSVFIVTAFNVPQAPEGKTYQLWAIKKGAQPMSMGTFDTDADGRATVIVPVGADVNAIDFIDLCAMTLEPKGGSPQPTETPRLVGSWRHTD
jgi:anti-sigma-K factor RskA